MVATSEQRLRIAQVATVASSVRALLSDQIQALQQWGAEVTALCAPGPEVPKLQRRGIPVQPVPMARQPAPWQDAISLCRLTRALRQGAFDVVITHTPKAGVIGPVAARLARVPVVIHTVHGLLFHDQTPPRSAPLYQALERWTAWWAHWLFFQSREDLVTARRLRLAPAKRMYYVGNGINLARFDPAAVPPAAQKRRELGLDPEDTVVGTIARLVYEKGLGEFLAAAEMLLPCFPRLKFLVVGPPEPGRPDAVPTARIRALTATGRFRFTGERPDVAELYAAMDVFVLPSHREGIPRAVMEASAMARPVVTTRIRGCREVVQDGVTGLLVPVRDAWAVAAAVAQILDSGCGPHLGAAGRALMQAEFTNELVHRRIIGALAEILVGRIGAPTSAGGSPEPG